MKKENVKNQESVFEILYECNFKSNDGHKMFHVKCKECGWETDMQKHKIKYVKKCNHMNTGKNFYIVSHSWENDRIGKIFSGMKSRCYNPNEKDYKYYGQKGVRICEEWLKNPAAFEEWALSNGYKDNLTIDRIDANKDYCPENCRWISLTDNAKYKTSTKMLWVDGESHTGREWAKILKLGPNTINTMRRNNSIDKVIEFIRRRKQDITKNRTNNQSWFEVYGLE